jgi:hypothetical protein
MGADVATTALSNGWSVTTFPPPASFDIAKTSWPEVGIPWFPAGSRAYQRCSELVQHARFIEPTLTPLDRKRRKLAPVRPADLRAPTPSAPLALGDWDGGIVFHSGLAPEVTPAEAGAPRGTPYGFEPGTLYHFDANAVMCNDLSPFSGALSDIYHPEILWVVISGGLAQ